MRSWAISSSSGGAIRGAEATTFRSAAAIGPCSFPAAWRSWSFASGSTCAGKRNSPTLISARASVVVGVSGGGTEECPPFPRAERRNVWKVFSASCRPTDCIRSPLSASSRPPPSLKAISASIRGRWCPVLPFHGHHVDVSDQQERLLRAGALHAGDEVPAARRRFQDLRGEAGPREAGLDQLEGPRLVAVARVHGGGAGEGLRPSR